VTSAAAAGLQVHVRNWTVHARCARLGYAPDEVRDLMFPAPRDNRQIARAKRFCHGCPVALACLADGVDDAHAVRAGLTADERRRFKAGAPVRACGSCALPYVPRPTNPTECTGCTGRTHRQVTPEDYKDDIIAMHHAGASGEEICLYFGFSRDEIRLAGKRWKIGLMRRPKSECGTANGARAHYRAGEPRCERCAEADRARQADRLVAA
jgi:hypothetical protein